MLKRHGRLLLVGGAVALLISGWWWGQPNDLRDVGGDARGGAGSHSEEQHPAHGASVVCERDCWIHFSFGGGEEPATVVPSDIEAAQAAKEATDDSGTLDQFDVLAQERMAHWAILVALLTGIGVVLLSETLRETANATNAAVLTEDTTREIGQAQTRAYIAAVSAEYETNEDNPVKFKLTIKNFGQSPARNIMAAPVFYFAVDPPIGGGIEYVRFEWEGDAEILGSLAASAETVFDMNLRGHYLGPPDVPFKDEVFFVTAEVEISYIDVFRRVRFASVDISEKGETQTGLPRTRSLTVKTSEGRSRSRNNEQQEDQPTQPGAVVARPRTARLRIPPKKPTA